MRSPTRRAQSERTTTRGSSKQMSAETRKRKEVCSGLKVHQNCKWTCTGSKWGRILDVKDQGNKRKSLTHIVSPPGKQLRSSLRSKQPFLSAAGQGSTGPDSSFGQSFLDRQNTYYFAVVMPGPPCNQSQECWPSPSGPPGWPWVWNYGFLLFASSRKLQ